MLSDVSQFWERFVFANLGPSGIGGSSSFSLTYATFLLRCKLDPSERRGALWQHLGIAISIGQRRRMETNL